MWLIIQIALGIALGFFIIVFWREILHYGIRGLAAVIVIALICGIAYFSYENYASYKKELWNTLGYLSVASICGSIIYFWVKND
jgi:hypothetical protein